MSVNEKMRRKLISDMVPLTPLERESKLNDLVSSLRGQQGISSEEIVAIVRDVIFISLPELPAMRAILEEISGTLNHLHNAFDPVGSRLQVSGLRLTDSDSVASPDLVGMPKLSSDSPFDQLCAEWSERTFCTIAEIHIAKCKPFQPTITRHVGLLMNYSGLVVLNNLLSDAELAVFVLYVLQGGEILKQKAQLEFESDKNKGDPTGQIRGTNQGTITTHCRNIADKLEVGFSGKDRHSIVLQAIYKGWMKGG